MTTTLYEKRYLNLIKSNLNADEKLIEIINQIYNDGFEDGVANEPMN